MNDVEFAERYYAAWNAHDIDAILKLYSDEIEFSSPYIMALGFSYDGVILGLPMLRSYLEKAFERAPDLRLTPEALFVGARGHTLVYRNQRGERSAEVHEMDALGRIVRADATYENT